MVLNTDNIFQERTELFEERKEKRKRQFTINKGQYSIVIPKNETTITGASTFQPTRSKIQKNDRGFMVSFSAHNTTGASRNVDIDIKNLNKDTSFPLNGLISYWKLDEASGNPTDEQGNHSLTATGITYGASGIINDAFTFDTSTDILSTDTTTGLTATDISFSFWMNIDDFDAVDTLLWFKDDVPNTYVAVDMFSGNLRLVTYDGVAEENGTTTMTGNLNRWVHVYGEVTATGLKLYLDNVLKIDESISFDRFTNVDHLRIGNGDTGARGVNGLMDEVGIWNRVLTTDEITQLYNEGNGLGYIDKQIIYSDSQSVGGNESWIENLFFSNEKIEDGNIIKITLGDEGIGSGTGILGSFFVEVNQVFIAEDETETNV